MADPDSPLGLWIRYRDASFARGSNGRRSRGCRVDRPGNPPRHGRVVEWDGIDLIEVRDGRICRNAVYSSAHAARVLDQPA